MHHAVGQFGQFGQGVRGISENEIKLLPTTRHKAQSIAAIRTCGRIVELAKYGTDETKMLAVFLDRNDKRAAARKQLECDRSRPGKQIERAGRWEVDVGAQDVEEIFFGKVGRRARLKGARHVEMSSFIFSGNDSHEYDL